MKEELELADKDLMIILEIEGNKTCNDCGKKDPLWCSINNAVLLCSTCARTHKKFNENVSKIKSLEVDEWTKEEILFLKKGGNLRFTNLIKSYNIPLTKENQEYKYYTKAAQYYRNILIEESKNNKIDNIIKPSLKEGIEILYKDEYSNLFNQLVTQSNNENNSGNDLNKKLNIINNSNNKINNNQTPENNNSSWMNRIIDKLAPDVDIPPDYQNNKNNSESKAKIFIDSIKSNMLFAINDVKELAKDIDFKEKFKMAGEYVQNKKEIIQNSDTFKGIMSTVSSGIGTIIEKTDKFFKPEQNKSNEINIININSNSNQNNQNIQEQNNTNNINNNNQINIQNKDNSNNNFINNNQNSNNENTGYLKTIINKITEPRFKSNYSSINNDKNSQYNNYINELTENTDIFNNINNDINNINHNKNEYEKININKDKIDINEKNKENNVESVDNSEKQKNKEENVESLDNSENEKNKKNNVESLDNSEEEKNPNLLIMSNKPNINQ